MRFDRLTPVPHPDPFAVGSSRPPLAELVRAAMGGDRAAFAKLYDEFEPTLFGIALARLPRHAAEDVVHDVFVSVLKQLPTLRDPAAFPGWITTITRHAVSDRLRRSPREDVVEFPQLASSSDREAGAILRVIQTLPEAFAETLVLRFVEGLTGPEIAERTGMTHGSVRVNLSRGMKLLRQRLAERGYDVG
jgi:RNA polymerase sigma-70 factor (ECF subfamily)